MKFRRLSPNELCHHGIKGQRWGIRRFQNPDGSLTSAGKERYRGVTVTKGSPDASNDIYKTLSKHEKQLVMAELPDEEPPRKFIKKKEAKYLLDQVLVKYGDTPVAALDLWNQGHGEASISIMTRSGEEYRNKGFADKAVKAGLEAFEKNKDLKVLSWGAWDENTPSKRLAEKNGFEYKDWHDPGGHKYVIYEKRKKEDHK